MDRGDLQQLSKEQLIELVLRLQRPDKTSRTSSKPPSTDMKETRKNARPGGAKPGHEPHNRKLAEEPDAFAEHVPDVCERCGGGFGADAYLFFISHLSARPPARPIAFAVKRISGQGRPPPLGW